MPVLFPDVEMWVTGYLRTALADPSVFVSNVDTGTTKTRRVIVRRDGGPRMSVASEVARLGVRVFAPTEQAASSLAGLVYAYLGAAAGSGPVRRFQGLSGPSAVADESGPMRYLVVELTVRGSDL